MYGQDTGGPVATTMFCILHDTWSIQRSELIWKYCTHWERLTEAIGLLVMNHNLQTQGYTTLFQKNNRLKLNRCSVSSVVLLVLNKDCQWKDKLPIEPPTIVVHKTSPPVLSQDYLKSNYLQTKCHNENIPNWVNCEYTILTCRPNFTPVIVLTLYELSLLNRRLRIASSLWRMTNIVSIRLLIKWIFLRIRIHDYALLCNAWHGQRLLYIILFLVRNTHVHSFKGLPQLCIPCMTDENQESV